MYKQDIYEIRSNEPLTASVFRMVLAGDTQWIAAPGQFVNVALPAASDLGLRLGRADADADL